MKVLRYGTLYMVISYIIYILIFGYANIEIAESEIFEKIKIDNKKNINRNKRRIERYS